MCIGSFLDSEIVQMRTNGAGCLHPLLPRRKTSARPVFFYCKHHCRLFEYDDLPVTAWLPFATSTLTEGTPWPPGAWAEPFARRDAGGMSEPSPPRGREWERSERGAFLDMSACRRARRCEDDVSPEPVPYTPLTLPTNREG